MKLNYKPIKPKVWNSVESYVWYSIYGYNRKSVSKYIRNYVYSSVYSCTYHSIWNTVRNTVRNTVGSVNSAFTPIKNSINQTLREHNEIKL